MVAAATSRRVRRRQRLVAETVAGGQPRPIAPGDRCDQDPRLLEQGRGAEDAEGSAGRHRTENGPSSPKRVVAEPGLNPPGRWCPAGRSHGGRRDVKF